MKIIREGNLFEDKVVRLNCLGCLCVFECAIKEMKLIFDQRDGDFYQIACPCCRKNITLDVKVARLK